MLFLGFGSGLPYILLISTSTAWLRDVNVDLSYIGFFTWITFTYTFKFAWAPLVDRFSIPFLAQYGHRKSWIAFMQILIFLSLLFISNIDPIENFILFCMLEQQLHLRGQFRILQ
jgi:PAT family beta-lactamase induction signal transducer AmpG